MSTYYGQKETDKVIANYFDNNYIGNCVEVGVSDGIKGSNTKYFEDNKWGVLCIDPIPEHVIAAKKIRKNVLEIACGTHRYKTKFHVFDIGEKNIKSSLSGLTPDERLFITHGHLINDRYTITVQVDRLDSILRNQYAPRKIDFISIDTEGTELDVLKGMDFNYFDVKLLVVENNFDDPDIEQYLKQFDYKKAERYFVNDFYIKDR